MSLACETCPVRDSAACAVLSEDERAELAKAGRTRRLKRGELLFAAGDEDTACATLISGALKVTSFAEDGSERILALIHPSGFVGEMFAPFASYDVVALTDSQLCVFAKADMNRALERHPALTRALLRRSQEDLHRAHMLLALGSGMGASDKVGKLLMALAQAASESPCHPRLNFQLPLTRGEMASMLGLTIETVSRALTALERDGLIKREGARGIEIIEPARLELLD
ncbi:Crp/Fnr family transcriptional regulator [Aurantiacibacter rhizosphaerae]|uniref:Helix-turn-helix domain-containing protein n=1 Tax=Aurantiacibacter rhizosphaerae TaxID=2691582 RepID=A0A844XFT9_9SPHN|nr:Crp/Fnr family transcriptional regulator [Aurantiacibacter rhizosphaerae]MWV28522.1 helix-turn-helix domain-containing protein [Aurantiacibacter rhizosphaerae]